MKIIYGYDTSYNWALERLEWNKLFLLPFLYNFWTPLYGPYVLGVSPSNQNFASAVDFLTCSSQGGRVWLRNRLLTSVFTEIDTPFSVAGCLDDKTCGRSLGVGKIAVKLEDVVAAAVFLSGGIWFGDRLLTSVSGGIDTPFADDSCYGDRIGGQSLGIAKIAFKRKNFVLAVDFSIRVSQGVSVDRCINLPENRSQKIYS